MPLVGVGADQEVDVGRGAVAEGVRHHEDLRELAFRQLGDELRKLAAI